ncbi:glycerol-3-phosphate transporter subunit; ATP-binding component of ABC superfamily [uncultured Sphingopyxis sp.]|uniref:Glycerol-3-phosphate transporter subunit ATP-binding component of ABC superfamily n=1 Tax=uncultured Sphingopyxis sp. TaxID=310581 RepID=A0A1Y5PQ65_9SPHN|nr:sn-glycerol-3-phosphate ABC transporter ATP-binding protein UgpC [uncultured Sphingopyxis sp.]SBV32110.1 glycerol-3-phosphate transporter subunit; ATP-binding component of ABC superfamily [uncultured Sphingopyxis sp.]
MAGLLIERARKNFGATEVLKGISIEVADGEFTVIVGPSGCGKSTLLRAVAGLEELTDGRVVIGDRDVTGLAPSQRGIAMVFQSYALYPHLSVYENMAFGLRIAKAGKAATDAAVRRAAAILNIEALLDRKPAALSGGQRQRVAIGRAIVRQPQIFLFDEPLSNLDADLRVRMRYEFAELHRQLGTTTLYVTHDQVEAMTLADRIIVMRDGRIEQVGTPRDLYARPANIFVAQFLGTPRMNILPATVVENGRAALAGGRSIALPRLSAPPPAGTPLSIGIRPEDIAVGDAPDALPFIIRFIERLGGLATLHLGGRDGDAPIACQLRDDGSFDEGDTVALSFAPAHLHLFGADGNALETAGE